MDLSDKKIVIIGGGLVAQRRMCTLMNFGVDITVVSPDLTDEIKKKIPEIRYICDIYKKEYIENSIRDAVFKVTGIKELDETTNLISKELGVIPVNFLYIFDILEENLELPVSQIFADNSYEVMCIKKMTDAFYKLQTLQY